VRAPEFWRRPGLAPTLLAPAAALYAWGGALRFHWTQPWHATVPVLCVGNLVAGGAGKTPIAASLARLLVARGRNAHLISRGYGGSETGPLRVDPARHTAAEIGDEPLLLVRDAPVWVGRDRVAAAQAASAAGADLLILDDGFQNPTIAKDLSFLVVDAGYGFGNRRVMPAGPLREPVERGLARADAIVVVGTDADELPFARFGLPVLHADLQPQQADDLVGRRVFAFAGIGRPEKFFATLGQLGATIVARREFADHHRFGEDEVREIIDAAARQDAVAVTTEKDAVRLPPALRERVRVLRVAAEWRDPEALLGLLHRFVLSPAPA
jgi:tetraacyldisaccharide 4'-kinase